MTYQLFSGDTVSSVEVVVEVGDENDNPPYFTRSTIVLGVPQRATYNHLVGTVQVPIAYIE